MSRHEFERGTIKLPSFTSTGFSMVHAAVVEAEDRYRDRLYRMAEGAHRTLLEMGRGKRGFDFLKTFEHSPAFDYVRGQDAEGWIHLALFPLGKDGKRARKPHKPKKKPFAAPTSRTVEFDHGEFSIVFDRKARTVSWNVQENNHACEDARRHPLGLALFNALGRVVWTRGTGGVIYGNDEYHRDESGPGGGGNYVNTRFGPVGKAEDHSFMR